MKSFISDPKKFVENFVAAFCHDAKVLFKIENTRVKNKFFLCIETYDKTLIRNDKRRKYSIEFSSTFRYNQRVTVPLDKIFKTAHPDLMFRDGIYVYLDDIVTKYGCNETAVMKQIVNGIKQIVNSIKTIFNSRYKNNGSFIAVPIVDETYTSIPDSIKFNGPSNVQSFEEFAVMIDLTI